jgi:O-antigen ligase
MTQPAPSTSAPPPTQGQERGSAPGLGLRRRCLAVLPGVMEGLLLVLVCLSPWAFGAVHPLSELVLYAGVAGLLLLWGLRTLLEGRWTWKRCPVALCLAALFLLGILQITPLPRSVLETLSPGTARLYEEFLPARPEALPPAEGGDTPAMGQPGSTLSVCPGATRQEVVRLLAVLLVFAMVRNNLATPAALRRLCVVALVNGVLLCFFALLQFFTSPRHVLYWTFPSQGQVYGPFICRNHFPFYVNLCVGLGLGLLLALRARGPGGRRSSPPGVLQDPRALWVVCGLGFMIAAEMLSLSRGGFVALAAGLLVCLAVKLLAGDRRGAAWGVVVPAVAVGLLGWLGLGLVEDRLGSLWKGDALKDERLPVWSQALRSVPDVPWWGTGYGSFPYVEPLHRLPGQDPFLFYDHAHNDYLEALVEGGAVRLAVTLAAVVAVLALGWRAVRGQQGRGAGRLALGALVAFTTAAVHSFVDFGLHTPAIALLLTVLAAHLAALGSRGAAAARGAADPRAGGDDLFRMGGLAPLLGTAAAALLGAVLVGEGWRAYQAERQRLAALHLTRRAGPGHEERALACLRRAVRCTPENAALQLELAEAHHRLYTAGLRALETREGAMRAAGAWSAGASRAIAPCQPLAPLGPLLARSAPGAGDPRGKHSLTREHLVPALRHYLLARDLCPLLDKPHVRLAAHRDALPAAEPRAAYLKRAKRLLAGEPDLWYICGLQELRDGQTEEAWKSWRRCLECSGRHLQAVLREVERRGGRRAALEKVLPDRPVVLVEAARFLVFNEEQTHKEELLRRALALLERPAAPAEDHRLRAEIYVLLDQPDRAVAAYEEALGRRPDVVAWRYELARLLRQRGRLQQARRELRALLGDHPGHSQARALYEEVIRTLAEK